MPSIKKSFEINANNAVKELQECLEEISRPSMDSTPDWYMLVLYDVQVTPAILALLMQVLNQPLHKSSTDAGCQWDRVEFHNCQLARKETARRRTRAKVRGYRYCTPEDMRRLGATVAHQTSGMLDLVESPDILECLFSTPQLEMKMICLYQAEFSGLECESLGDLIQRSLCLRYLGLYLTHLEAPEALVESLGNAINLKELSVMDWNHCNGNQPQVQELPDILAKQGGNDMVVRLLQNPQSRLQKLNITGMHLQDHHFMAMVEALSTSQLEELNVADNDIQCPGILAFAAQLPRIQRLKLVQLCRNPWENEEEGYEQCCAALLQGLLKNYSIEVLNTMACSPHSIGLLFYCNLNRAGRRILATPHSAPVGTWPFILERAGNDKYHLNDDDEMRIRLYRAESMYFFLQNSPFIGSSSSFLKNNPRKKGKVMG